MNKKEILDNLFYNIGKQNFNFELTHLELDPAKNHKWRKYSELCFDSEDSKNQWFVDQANNRTILGNEIVLDLEEPERFDEVLTGVKKEFKYYSAYKTGSRGNHIHLFFNRKIESYEKLKIIKNFKCDEQKATDRCMIALELSPHWKTGNPKELIEESKGMNSLIVEKEEKLKNVVSQYYNKEDLAENLLDLQPLFYDENKIWWVWISQEFRWKIADETDILNFVRKLSNANTINSREKSEIIESLKQSARIRKPKEIKSTWIQFKDKFVDIETGEELDVTPKYFATNPISYSLDKERYSLTPEMDRIFAEWVGEENVKTLYEIIAYCLIPSYPIHRLFCLIGPGMNGKSCFLRLIEKFIGKANITSTELDTLLSSRFEITRLHKKLVCVMGETNFNEMNKTSILKKLTGQDTIGFEYKNKNPFEDLNYAKILIATNNLPTTSDKTIGFYRRWLIIDFPNQFSEQKDILDDIPEEEYGALAVKSLTVLKDLLETRAFTNEGSVEDRMERYESKSNFLDKFIKDFTTEDLEGYITKASFSKKFNSWCVEKKYRTMSEASIGMAMKKLGIETEQRYFNWMNDGRGGQLRCWRAIKWVEDTAGALQSPASRSETDKIEVVKI